MNRCALGAFAAACVLALAGCGSSPPPPTGPAARNFPADALRGQMSFGQPPEIVLNGQPARLAPGARIRGTDNLLLMSGAMAGSRHVVHYTVEIGGLIKDVWVLTPEERARTPWPTSPEQAKAWRFDPLAQTWSRP